MAGRMAVFMALLAGMGPAVTESVEAVATAGRGRELSHAVIISIDSLRADHLS